MRFKLREPRLFKMEDGVLNWTHGPSFEEGGIRFRLWAPGEERVGLVIDGRDEPVAMTPGANGFFETFAKDLRAGARYRFQLSGGEQVPDPASRFQPDDVNGPSEAIDPGAYRWQESWPGRQWDDIVLYELHVGAFSPEGTFAGAALEARPSRAPRGHRGGDHAGQRFQRSPELGLRRGFSLCSRRELRPTGRLQGFRRSRPRAWNRGVARRRLQPFRSRGELPSALRARFLHQPSPDPVGRSNPIRRTELPSGARLLHRERANIGSRNFISTDCASTPSTPSRTTRGPICSTSSPRGFARVLQRPVHLVLENEDNDPRRLARRGGKADLYTAQWNDDIHHVLHVAATHERAATMPPMAEPSFWEEPSRKALPIRAR